jgi:RNA processing factor Prp31
MNQCLQQRRYDMHINDTTRQMIREIVVELFKETLETNPTEDKEVIQLTDTLDDIIKNKVDNYRVEVYGVSLKEY